MTAQVATALKELLHGDQANTAWQPLPMDTFASQYGGANFSSVMKVAHVARQKQAREEAANDPTLEDRFVMEYQSSKWALPFHQDNTSTIKGLKSCVGSGKSSAICVELIRLASLQNPDKHGVRHSKVVVIRATHGELHTTTLNTIIDWFPDAVCRIVRAPRLKGEFKMSMPDGTSICMLMEFLALDQKDSIKHLQGLEATFIWINEFAELRDPYGVLKVAVSRLRRYPAKKVAPIRWSGVLIDFNPSSIDSYPYKLFMEQAKQPGSGIKLYEYPPALIRVPDPNDPDNFSKSRWVDNPEADFHRFNDFGYEYWRDLVNKFGDDENYVRKMVLGDWTLTADGASCFPSFSTRDHVGTTYPDPTQSILIGADGGLFPGIVIAQLINGQVQIHDELLVDDIVTEDLLDNHLLPLLRRRFNGFPKPMGWLDPGNDKRADVSQKDVRQVVIRPSMIYQRKGNITMQAIPQQMNRVAPRHGAVSWFLRRRNGLLIDPRCKMLIRAMAGEYKWDMPASQTVPNSGTKPVKDRWSDIADALQYLCVGLRQRGYGMAEEENAASQWSQSTAVTTMPISITQSSQEQFLYV